MKYHLFLLGLLAIAALANPIPEDEGRGDFDPEYDPDCEDTEEVDGDVIQEPAPEIGGEIISPGQVEPAIKIPIEEDIISEEDCEDEPVTEEVTTIEVETEAPIDQGNPDSDGECEPTAEVAPAGCDADPCQDGCDQDCDECPHLDACRDPCEDDPCASGCAQNCDECPDLDKCDPCLENPCDDGCDQPCEECPGLDKCKADPTPTCEAEVTEDPCADDVCAQGCDQPCDKCPGLAKCAEPAPGSGDDGECEGVEEEDAMANEPVIKVAVEAAHVVPDEIIGDPETDESEDCVEEFK